MKTRKSLYGPVVGYHRRILQIVPNSKAAATVLTQMIFHHAEYRADSEGWFRFDRVRSAEMWDMSPNIVDRSREYWRGLGVLNERIEGVMPKRLFCRIDFDKLDEILRSKRSTLMPSKPKKNGNTECDSGESETDRSETDFTPNSDSLHYDAGSDDVFQRQNDTESGDPSEKTPSAEDPSENDSFHSSEESTNDSADPAREWIRWLPMAWRGDDELCSVFEQLVVQRGLDQSGAKLVVARLKTWPDDRRVAFLEWAVMKNARIVKYDPEKHAARDFEQPVGASINVNPKDLPWV